MADLILISCSCFELNFQSHNVFNMYIVTNSQKLLHLIPEVYSLWDYNMFLSTDFWIFLFILFFGANLWLKTIICVTVDAFQLPELD